MNEQRTKSHASFWLASVAVAGSVAFVLAAVVFWTLVSSPQSVIGAEEPAIAVVFGRWTWHLLHLVATWL